MSKVTEQDYIDYLELINDGYSQRKAAKILGVPRTTLQDYIKRKQVKDNHDKQETIKFDVSDAFSSLNSGIKSFAKAFSNNYPNAFEKQKPISKKKPTILVIADTQCKSEENLEYMLWIGQYIADKKPDVIVHIGDHYDFPSLSSYDKGKSSAEGKRLIKDIEAGNKGFEYLNMAMQSIPDYNPRKVFCIGNHCERLSRYVDDNPELIGTLGLDKLPFEEYGWEVHPFLKPVEIEGIFFVHYLANPFSGKPYGGNAMNILKTVGRSFVVGHKQCLDIAIRPTIDGKQQIGIINGAAYPFDEKYKGYQGNNHFRGITMLYEVEDGFGLPKFISINHLKERYYS